jgi:hypothetical protein
MLIVGYEGCATCNVVKKFLPDVEYIELSKEKKSTPEILQIKKALGKLNPSNNFPVAFNDDYTQMADTKFIIDNMNEEKILNKLANQ